MEICIAILAGGLSSRFWPLEEKNLFEFFGTPLIIYQIKRYYLFFKRAGIIPHFIVVSNEKNYSQIKRLLSDNNFNQVQLTSQSIPNQSGAVICALKKVTKKIPFLVVNANDIFSETLVGDLINKVNNEKITLAATKVNSYFPGGYLKKNSQGEIIEIIEKPDSNTVPSQHNLFRFVFDYFPNKSLLETALDPDKESPSYEEAINKLLKKTPGNFVFNEQPFTSLKYPWHILAATNIFLNNIKQSVVKTQELEQTSQIVGKVIIAKGVKIGSYSKIVGPTYIGPNTVIGDHCLIRHCHIGKNCLIGAHCEVARSYLGNKILLHRNYIGDSVLSEGTSFGAGSLTANWRFDEQLIKSKISSEMIETDSDKLGVITGSKVKVGINASIMPGVKIGKNNRVFPSEVVYKDKQQNNT
jgi:UDP-N-acetylglucosamine diphosphorylase / glucose-1-phosphate thymidylyltransferase / UDP-N-acetylgalactosamine diphosphorylase / glucosamine-1-phosphate N-acetyltransferase / galactosamine-1-phosphate N-acetyltransferase